MAPGGMSIGERVRWARKRAGLSQERLAQTIGTTRQVVIRWEQDRHVPNEESRRRIAEATGQDAGFFAEADEEDDADGEWAVSLAVLLERRVRELVAEQLLQLAS
jgi:transcriptional regulator with XRE-family HTH domain